MAKPDPETRLHELLAAATVVFLARGYRRTQMADVAAELGIAKGTVYLYVESKEALFDLVIRHADAGGEAPIVRRLPVPTPRPGATLRYVRDRLERDSPIAALERLASRRPDDVPAELEAVLGGIYDVLAANRIAIKLVDRCAADHPELGAVWFRDGRERLLAALRRYLESPARKARLRPFPDVAAAARVVIETLVFWAVHRHWDPSPQRIAEPVARATAIEFLRAAFTRAEEP